MLMFKETPVWFLLFIRQARNELGRVNSPYLTNEATHRRHQSTGTLISHVTISASHHASPILPESVIHSSPRSDSGIPMATSLWVFSVRNMWTPRPNSEK